jgi:hypothetical protein
MSKRYYQEIIFKDNAPEVRVCDSKRSHVEFAVYCDNESHADALAGKLNQLGYEVTEFYAIQIANVTNATSSDS